MVQVATNVCIYSTVFVIISYPVYRLQLNTKLIVISMSHTFCYTK